MTKYNENQETRQAIDACLMGIMGNRAQYLGTDSKQSDIDKLNALNAPLKERIKMLDHEFFKTAFYEEQ